MDKICEILMKKYRNCLFENTREGVWQYYECRDIIKKFRDTCLLKQT